MLAPRAMAGRSSISPLNPSLRAMRTTLPLPVFISASTVATLMDRLRAPRMVYSPPYIRSWFSGVQLTNSGYVLSSFSKYVHGEMPFSKAAAYTIGLNAEAVCRRERTWS